MEYLLLALVWLLNLAISFWNAYACGKAWAEAKFYGGWPRFMTWMGAIMAASGFSWCFLILLASAPAPSTGSRSSRCWCRFSWATS